MAAALSFVACACEAGERAERVERVDPVEHVERLAVLYGHSPDDKRLSLLGERRRGSFVVANHRVPDAHVAALVASLTNLHEADGLQGCADHTDDYPSLRITLETPRRNIVLSSTSNCAAMVPWNVVMNGRLYVQYDGAIGRAVGQLMHDLDPSVDVLRSRYRPAKIHLDGVEAPPPGVLVTASVGRRLESIVTRDPAYSRFFGTERHIVDSDFWCGAGDECRKRQANIVVAWDSRLQVSFDGTLDGEKVVSLELDDERRTTFDKFRESPLAKAMPFDLSYPIYVGLYSERCPSLPNDSERGDCKVIMMRGGKRGDEWSPQMLDLRYYPELNVVSVHVSPRMDGRDSTPEVMQAFVDLGNDRGVIKRAFSDREAYFRLDGHIVANVDY